MRVDKTFLKIRAQVRNLRSRPNFSVRSFQKSKKISKVRSFLKEDFIVEKTDLVFEILKLNFFRRESPCRKSQDFRLKNINANKKFPQKNFQLPS